MSSKKHESLLAQVEKMNEQELRRVLVEHLSKKKLGLVWESSAIARDQALNSDVILPELVEEISCFNGESFTKNLIIEGDNFDSLRLLRNTHRGRIRVIYIDPPYNTGNKDWVYNDKFVGEKDRYRHSQWLEFMHQRMTLARDLLTPDGVILISINDENRSRLELMMDEVMPGRRLGSLAWKKRKTSNAAGVENFFSCDHEHVLVYGSSDFSFAGSAKNWDKYDQWDELEQDWWASTQLTLGFNRNQRPNLYYPLNNPITGIWYPCDSNRVWARATESRLNGKEVRTESMEVLIARNGVSFPYEKEPSVYTCVEEIKSAISDGSAPPHLESQEDLAFWVGKKIGRCKPRFKTYKSRVRSEYQPLSSWITESNKGHNLDEDTFSFSSGLTSEGTRSLREIGLDTDFPYPKPLSLVRNLLQQATLPGDIVLDFFSGSGTTGHAVLDLNAEDGGNRTFILCSSTEATASNPGKNLCRDICSERIRRVIQGYSKTPGTGGNFAYIRAVKMNEENLPYLSDDLIKYAFEVLSMRDTGGINISQKSNIKVVSSGSDLSVIVCGDVNQKVIDQLREWPTEKLAVYSSRPKSIKEGLDGSGKLVNTYGLMDVLLSGLTGSDIYE